MTARSNSNGEFLQPSTMKCDGSFLSSSCTTYEYFYIMQSLFCSVPLTIYRILVFLCRRLRELFMKRNTRRLVSLSDAIPRSVCRYLCMITNSMPSSLLVFLCKKFWELFMTRSTRRLVSMRDTIPLSTYWVLLIITNSMFSTLSEFLRKNWWELLWKETQYTSIQHISTSVDSVDHSQQYAELLTWIFVYEITYENSYEKQHKKSCVSAW